MNTSTHKPMRRVRTKTYSVTLYLVLFAVAIQFVVIIWNFSIRSQVKIDIQAPELPTEEVIPSSPIPAPNTLVEAKNTKPTPLGITTTKPISESLSPLDRVKNLLAESHRFLEQGETSLARNTLLEAEAIQPDNSEVLSQLADLADKIQNKELATQYRERISQLENHLNSPLRTIPPESIEPPIQKTHDHPESTQEIAQITSSLNPISPQKKDLSSNLIPILPPPVATSTSIPQSSNKRFTIGVTEKKSLQSSTSKTEFLLKIPIVSLPSEQVIVPGKVSIKLYFYELQPDGKILPSNARLDVSFENKRPSWSTNSETLNALYSLSNTQLNRTYYGYRMRIYYKDQFQCELSEPENLNEKYPMNY